MGDNVTSFLPLSKDGVSIDLNLEIAERIGSRVVAHLPALGCKIQHLHGARLKICLKQKELFWNSLNSDF